MPIIALAGIPWLAGVLGGLFASIFSFFVKFFTRRIAVAATITVSLLLLVGLFVAACTAALSYVSYSLPDIVSQGLSWTLPDNTTGCVTAIMTAKIARYVFIWKARVIQLTWSGL